MSDTCSCYITVVYQMKNGIEICSRSRIDDIKICPTMLVFLNDSDMAQLLNPLCTGDELINAIDKQYAGMYRNDSDKEFNMDKISPILFSDVLTIIITAEMNDEYGETKKTFYYCPETKECTCEEDTHSAFMDEYSGDNENAEAILTMYNMGGESPESIAEILGISVGDVYAVIEGADDLDYEE